MVEKDTNRPTEIIRESPYQSYSGKPIILGNSSGIFGWVIYMFDIIIFFYIKFFNKVIFITLLKKVRKNQSLF